MKKIFLNFKANKTSPFFWIKTLALVNFLFTLSVMTIMFVNTYMNHQIEIFLNEYLIETLIVLGLPLFYFFLFHFLPENRRNLTIVKYLFLFQIPVFNFDFIAYKLGLILPFFLTYERQIINSNETNLALNTSWTAFDSWLAYNAAAPFSIESIGLNLFALAIFLLTTYKLKKTRR